MHITSASRSTTGPSTNTKRAKSKSAPRSVAGSPVTPRSLGPGPPTCLLVSNTSIPRPSPRRECELIATFVACRCRMYHDARPTPPSPQAACASGWDVFPPPLTPPLAPPALRRRDLARVRAAWRATHSHTHTPAPAASRTHIYLRFRTVWSLGCVSWQWRCRPKCRPTHCFRSPQRWGCHFRSQRWGCHFRSPQRWVCHFRSPQRWVCSCSPPFSMLAKAS